MTTSVDKLSYRPQTPPSVPQSWRFHAAANQRTLPRTDLPMGASTGARTPKAFPCCRGCLVDRKDRAKLGGREWSTKDGGRPALGTPISEQVVIKTNTKVLILLQLPPPVSTSTTMWGRRQITLPERDPTSRMSRSRERQLIWQI